MGLGFLSQYYYHIGLENKINFRFLALRLFAFGQTAFVIAIGKTAFSRFSNRFHAFKNKRGGCKAFASEKL